MRCGSELERTSRLPCGRTTPLSRDQPVRSRRVSESTARMLGESRVKIRHRIAVRVVVLMTALIVLTYAEKNRAQVAGQSAASLDVQVPFAPTPVRINGQACIAYELRITNYRAVDLSLTRIDV